MAQATVMGLAMDTIMVMATVTMVVRAMVLG